MPWRIQDGDRRVWRVVVVVGGAWFTCSMFQGLTLGGRGRRAAWQTKWLDGMLFQGQIFREESSSGSAGENYSHYCISNRTHPKVFNPSCTGSMLKSLRPT